MKQTLKVPKGAAAERLDVFLAQAMPATRSHASRLLKSGYVLVNDKPARASYITEPGDKITVEEPEAEASVHQAPDLPVVYEDADVLVIDKPAGLASHTGSGLKDLPTVADFARLHTSDSEPERPGIIHRLDRDTSGLMIIAKTPEAKSFMQAQFRNRDIEKTYILLAVGKVDPPKAIIRLPLDRDPAHPLKRAVVTGGREAVTVYETLESYPGYTLVEAKPETGRTHQIRVHFAFIGHPVAGDSTYGPPQKAFIRTFGLKRHFLHAATLSFTVPSGQRIQLESPLPDELKRVITALEKRV